MNSIETATVLIVNANNETAFDLIRQLDDGKDANVFISPLSINTALNIATNGARGATLAEMQRTLHLPAGDMTSINAAAAQLVREFTYSGRNIALQVANGLFVQEGYPLVPEFVVTARNQYSATVDHVNFKTPAGASRINKWVNTNTNGRITDIVHNLPPDTPLVIGNAVYFLAPWKEDFSTYATKPAPFFLKQSDEIELPFMSHWHHYRYQKAGELEVIRLPYKEPSSWEMVLLLPAAGSSIDAAMQSMNGTVWQSLVNGCQWKYVDFAMPKYKIEYSHSLCKALAKMGMPTAFDPRQADLSGIASVPGQPLYIGDVLHKTFLDVNEKGTEAAAATAVIPAPGCAAAPLQPEVKLRIDRPFIVAIRDAETSTIPFLGSVRDPRK